MGHLRCGARAAGILAVAARSQDRSLRRHSATLLIGRLSLDQLLE
jgi:hypothetical protein